MSLPDPSGAIHRQEARVQRYYGSNALLFRAYERLRGLEQGPLPIHRRLWAPGVRTVGEALRTSSLAILRISREYASVLDLGCGEGATLVELARGNPDLHLGGLTLSRAQATVARRRLGALGRHGIIVQASYLDPAAYPTLPAPRLFVAVESANHAPAESSLFKAAAARADRGDALLVVDDFAAEPPRRWSRAVRKYVRASREGWRIPSLQHHEDFLGTARGQGWVLEEERDWTPWMRTGDGLELTLSRLLVPLGSLRLPPVLGQLVGGSSLLLGYRRGYFRYRLLLLRFTGPRQA